MTIGDGGGVRVPPWEPVVGYSRVVRAGPWVLVAGSTATDATGTLVDRRV